jgi:predicted DCC family thiol-disulfide oxidoreductase YuxK
MNAPHASSSPVGGASAESSTHSIVLYDGECGFCNASVRFLIKRDPHAHFRFAAQQSEVAQSIIKRAGWTGPLPDSVILLEPLGEGYRIRIMSDASIAIATQLGFPWSLAAIARVLPLRLRNAAYKLLAKHRYKLPGKNETCPLPDEATRARFLS